jgi:hypothetical protein
MQKKLLTKYSVAHNEKNINQELTGIMLIRFKKLKIRSVAMHSTTEDHRAHGFQLTGNEQSIKELPRTRSRLGAEVELARTTQCTLVNRYPSLKFLLASSYFCPACRSSGLRIALPTKSQRSHTQSLQRKRKRNFVPGKRTPPLPARLPLRDSFLLQILRKFHKRIKKENTMSFQLLGR